MRRLPPLLALCVLAGLAAPLPALVNYDAGQRLVLGVQLLQDANDARVYHYLPQFPRLATRADGSFEILCLKYVDSQGGTSGGLFHALVEFTLPPELVTELERELRKEVPDARIAGPVALMQAGEDGEEGMGSFQVVSATLADRAEGGFTRSLVTSGKAPLTPGSRAVVAALLSPAGATLLWDSMSGATSDVSVALHATYEALVQGYNARVHAEMSTVYNHLSRISNQQKDYTKRQLRKVVDDLQRDGTLSIEVVDRSAGLGIKASEMEGILQVVTDKLTELMFDHTSGWATEPPREAAVEVNQILGRQDRGWFASTFLGAEDTKYYTDDQYVLKKREDIKHNVFSLTLAKSTTIKVPVDTSGNLGGLFDALGGDERYFRVVNLEDPDFERRTVHFQIDGEYLDSFADTINFVSVNFRKLYPDRPPVTRSLHFSSTEVKAGKTIQEVDFPRLGQTAADWTSYEYQVRWSLRDRPTLMVPPQPDRWLKSADAAVSLVPPFAKRVVEIDADRQLFQERGVVSAVVEFATVLGGKADIEQKAVLKVADAEPSRKVSIYHDRETPVGLRVSWHAPDRQVRGELEALESDYLFLSPPPPPPPPAGGAGGGR